MASTDSSNFNILGSAKLNTPDGKNPPPSSTDSSGFGILGSSKLNTADGKNPSSASTASQKIKEAGDAVKAAAGGDTNSEEYKKSCQAAHDALEDRLREQERLARWRRE